MNRHTRWSHMGIFLLSLCVVAPSLATDDHLYLTEAVVTPTAAEFIEIANPTGSAIALDNYYLSDDMDYALLPGASGTGPAPSIGSSDFITRFPAGASIAAGAVAVIAFDGAGFELQYGFKADYEISGSDAGTTDMTAVNVGASAGLTNSGEGLTLFFWDGASDLVSDVDMMVLGTPSASNAIANKTGLSVDGPDGDANTSTYAAEAGSIPQQPTGPGSGFSTKRIATEAGNETAGGNGQTGDDETSENTALTWDTLFSAPDPGLFTIPVIVPEVVINEVDADTAGTDALEFIELFGTANLALDGLVVVLFNGSDDASYDAFDLDGFSLDANGFFVIGNAGVNGVDLVVPGNTIQNGADAVALILGDAADFPNDTPVTDVDLLDALVYDTNDSDDAGLLAVLTPGQSQLNEDGGGDKDNHANARLPDGGMGGDTSTYVQQAPTPDAPNAGIVAPAVVINEVDADTAGTDTAEFLELFGDPNTSLDGLVVVLYNGSNDQSYAAYDLDGFSLDSNGFFVIGNAAVAAADLVVPSNSLQNGADAVALYMADAADFPSNTPVTDVDLLDALVYDTNDSDDAALLGVLTPGQSQINEGGAGDKDNHANARVPNGGTALDTSSYVQQTPTPGASNVFVSVNVVINEVDADTAGSDAAEFVELYGDPNTLLDGLVVVFYNGNGDTSYAAYDLDGFSLDGNGFFLMGNAGVANTDLTFSNNGLQNGADAVALYAANDADFPSGTPVTNVDLIDALVYDTNDSDDATLLATLVPGQSQINEGGAGDKDNHSNARLPDGGVALNTTTYVQQAPTPGYSNIPVPDVYINEVDADTPGSDVAEFIELFGAPNTSLDGLVVVLFNGSSDTAYNAWDLDGFSLNGDGFFVLGNTAVANVDLVISSNSVQNGADAVAIFVGNATDFPNGSPVTTDGLIDALVYDTDDSDDAGLAVLLNLGQPQVNERDGGNGTGHANARVPDGGILRNTDTYLQQDPTPGAPNFVEPPVTIAQIQGAGDTSPFEGQTVRSLDNVVTAVTGNGFYMQTQDANTDGDPATSEGIFVFTSAAPAVAVGDLVEVEGGIVEFFGFTEFSGGVTYAVTSSGNPQPAAITLDATTPSPIPQAMSDLEPFEGMVVGVVGATASSATNRFGNIAVVAGSSRAYREPGLIFPGQPGLPVWDGNPELFEINPDGAGLPQADVFAGATIDATGPLGFSFGQYQIQPTAMSVTPVAQPLPGARARNNGEITIGSQNMFRLFRGEPDATSYADRLTKFSMWIRERMGAPDILALQEVGTIEVLDDLAAQIAADDASINYTVYLIEGNDIGGIDVGFMVRDSISVTNVSQIQPTDTYFYNGTEYTLHDRPPLLLEGAVLTGGNPFPINVISIHNRSLGSIETNGRVPVKRWEQADRIAQAIADMQLADPDMRLVVTGDFNAFEFTDGYADCTGIMSGNLDPLGALIPGIDHINPNLFNQVLSVPSSERYSFVFGGSAQTLDNLLTSAALDPFVVEMAHARGNADVPAALGSDASTAYAASDHDGLVLYLFIDSDGDGIPDADDTCPSSDLTETVVIDGCDSSVPNLLLPGGCTISDLIAECAEGASNHGKFVSCVSQMANDLKKDGLISGSEKGAITSCAAQADIP